MNRSIGARGRPLLVAFVLLAAGCAGKMQVGELARQFDPASLQKRPVAIGGVILGQGVELDASARLGEGSQNADFLVQADTWSVHLYRPFLTRLPEVAVWPWPTVSAQADPVALAAVHEVFARRGIIKPEQIQALARSLPEVGFLALARIEDNQIATEQSLDMITGTQKIRDGRDVHADPLDRTVKVRRQIQVGLEVYDLESGLLEWRGTVTRRRDELFNYQDAPARSRIQVQAEDADAASPVLELSGSPVIAPNLEELLADACSDLVQELTSSEE